VVLELSDELTLEVPHEHCVVEEGKEELILVPGEREREREREREKERETETETETERQRKCEKTQCKRDNTTERKKSRKKIK